MTIIIRQIRTLFNENTIRHKKTPTPKEIRRKSLSVKISKEPPAIVYFQKDTLEDSFEYIFDPKVHHDEEKDHPDLFKQRNEKPWQKPPYKQTHSFLNKFKSSFNNSIFASSSVY